ncbi:Maf family protein [Planctomonas psychrotolerans]|uniref:Maf family protein n=1 Tax=Planctomonas psychrotolerans TaxID=2528712 RepID=UPI0012394EE3|nr:Maf family protein [Planctomonas psychrotolerans]
MRLYLASTSPARLATLRAAGIEPVLLPSLVDEDAVVRAAEAERGPLPADEMVQLLARTKAEAAVALAAATEHIDGLVLGGDSAFEIDGMIHGKPHTAERARERWHAQRGRSGLLHSGHHLIAVRAGVPGRSVGCTSVATVEFADDITDAEIDAYVATGEPLAVAGAFTIDSLGAAFITTIDGDPHTVVGLSVSVLRRLVRSLDVEWTSLWNRSPAS